MRVTSVCMTNFWSIIDSGSFSIDDVTCLVGKNESGKTAVLRALYRLNPIIPSDGKFDVTNDYPRAYVEDYQQAVENDEQKPAIVVRATFGLEDEDTEDLDEDYGKGVIRDAQMVLSKGYDNKTHVTLSLDERQVIASCLGRGQVPTDLAERLERGNSYREFLELIQTERAEGTAEHLQRLKGTLPVSDGSQSLVSAIYSKYLETHVPKFLYFDEYYQMRGHENIEQLKARLTQNQLEPSDRPLLGLIRLARLELDDLIAPDRTEWLINKLEGASNHLSRKILKYWSQNKHLQLKFDVRPARPGDPQGMTSGNNLWARVYDSTHLVTTPLGSRSRGFVWFFSFLAWFEEEQKKKEPLILLLDEPGLFLHGAAQGDLLRYLDEELRPNHQVLYTTHSPFMVDPQRFDRVRIVQDKSMNSESELAEDEEGTMVFTDVLLATEDSLFPLQGALGYEIHQTLFVGPNCLVIEGVSDLLYIQTISGVLERAGREGLSSQWTLTPVGGADKVPTFVALLGAQRKLKIATLIDFQKKDQQELAHLYKRKLLSKKYVHTFAEFCDAKEADIEDMLGDVFFLELVNREYAAGLKEPVKSDDLTSKSPRLVVRMESYFHSNPLKGKREFNHYRPARYFAENVADLEALVPIATLDRFEMAFREMNSLLG